MRILVTNAYSYKNKGDAAIVLALLEEIRRVFDKPEIVIQTTDVLNDEGMYGAPVASSLLWILLSRVRDRSPLVRVWVPLSGIATLLCFCIGFRLFGRCPDFLLSKDLKEFVRENRRADFAIGCGGGYLRSPNASLRETILFGVVCLNLLTAKYLGKNVYLYSQSIGPVHSRLQRNMLRFTLTHMDLIELREDASLEYVQQLKIPTRTVVTADPALLLGGRGKFPAKQVKLRRGRLHVGITVRRWFDNPKDFEAYLLAVAKTIDYLIMHHDAEVFYIPQVVAENFSDDDRATARQVWRNVKKRTYFTMVEADLHPLEIIGICSEMDIFIGTRMHSNIFALISDVPVVAIGYEHKTKGIMRGLGLEELTVDIHHANFSSLKQKVDLLLDKRVYYKEIIQKNLPAQIKQSKSAIEAIERLQPEREAAV